MAAPTPTRGFGGLLALASLGRPPTFTMTDSARWFRRRLGDWQIKVSPQTLFRFFGFCDTGSGICHHSITITAAAIMVGNGHRSEELIRTGAHRLTGLQRRLFQAEVCLALCTTNPEIVVRCARISNAFVSIGFR